MTAWLAVLAATLAAASIFPARPRPVASNAVADTGPGNQAGWMLRFRPLWCVLAGVGVAAFVGGRGAPVAGIVAALGAWVVITRAEPPGVRRAREQVGHDLPHVVELLASTLGAGAAPGDAIAVVCDALPGEAASRLAGVSARLAIGLDPVRVWESLLDDAELAPLGRTLARAQATGAPVVPAIQRLADDLARRSRADVEERARTVGVKAALPLGLCLLPAFLLIGIVPLVVGLLSTLSL